MSKTDEDLTKGRGWAYTGAILGGLVSVAANVAHSFIPPRGAPAGWSPEPGAVVGAIVWPVFLFIAVEILARIAWPAGKSWVLLRWVGLLPVALVAAFVSYRHLSGLLAHYGEEPIVYYLGPLAVDGLMIMATGALLAIHTRTRTDTSHDALPHPAAVPNAPQGAPAAVPASPFPAVPAPVPVAATTTVDVRPVVPAPQVPAAPNPPASHPAPPARPTPRPAPAATKATPTAPAARRSTPPTNARPRGRQSAPTDKPAPSTTDIHVTASDAVQLALPVRPAMVAKARHLAERHRTETGTPITHGQLAARMQIPSEMARQIMAMLDLSTDSPTRTVDTVNGTPTAATR